MLLVTTQWQPFMPQREDQPTRRDKMGRHVCADNDFREWQCLSL